VDDAGIATYQPPHSTTMQDDSMWRAQRVIENGHIVGASAQATLWAQAVETFLDSNRNGNEHSMDELPTVPPKLRNDGRNECWWNAVLQATLSMLHELHLRPVALENGTTSDVYRIFLFAFPELRNHTPNKDVLWAQLVEHQFVSALDQGQQSEADTFWLNLMSEGPLSHLVRTGKLTCTRFAQETTTLVPRHSANGAHLVPVVSDYKGTILNMNFDHLKETCIRPCA
jgi:hypothetical protein